MLLRALAVVGVVVLVALLFTWLNRRTLARDALTGWLESQGVPARAEVLALGPDTFTARLSIGDPRRPDFAADAVDVRYRIGPAGVELVSVTLRNPVLRAQLKADGLHVGALDPLIQDFLKRPPKPDAAQPRIVVERGVLRLATDYGPLTLFADARVENGQLQTLAGAVAPARLRTGDTEIALGTGALRAGRQGGALQASLVAPLAEVRAGETRLEDGRVQLSATLPYPDATRRRADGAVTARLDLTAGRLAFRDSRLETAVLTATFAGRSSGWLQDLALTGRAGVQLTAANAVAADGAGRRLRATVAADDLRWTRQGGDRIAATLRGDAQATGVSLADLRLEALSATLAGPVRADARGLDGELVAALSGRGGWTGLGPADAQDSAEVTALKRAARSFEIRAPAVTARLSPKGATVGLPQPVRLTAQQGAAVTLAARGAAPVFGPDGGAFRLTVAGGGLPRAEAEVSRLALTDRGVAATGRLRAEGSIGPMRGGRIEASGRVTAAAGGVSVFADRCVTVSAVRLAFDANEITDLAGRLCPRGGPVFALRNGAWQVVGRAEGVRAAVPFAQARLSGGAGVISARGAGDRMQAALRVTAARVTDTAAETRFQPLAVDGDVSLREFIWRADLAVRRPSDGAPLGLARITHDGRLGFGAAVIDTATLAFEPNGLQPAQLSPLAGALGPPVTGQAQFSGRFDWSPAGATSAGTLTVPSLDFTSPAGPVKGLKGTIVFESLAPLKAAAGQELTIDEVQGPVLLTGLRARFELADQLLKVEGGEAAVGGGRVRVETLEVPLVPGAPTRGVLFVEGVQLHDLVEASPFGDKVELDAKVSGRVPFEVAGNRVRISGGELKADQPGRLSIDRAALTGVQAGPDGAAPAPSPNDTFTDFAYQAMENLAFDTLSLSLASRDDGRLGMLFHIVGRHDPPQKQQIRLSVMDLIRQRFLGRKLPLPSGTGVNLTLDSTINLDDLLGDWAEYQRVRSGSAAVQP